MAPPDLLGHGQAPAEDFMDGKIVPISVGVTIETPDGPQKTMISLSEIRRRCRRERVEDLLDDLSLLIADVQRARGQGAATQAPRG